jgi:predicted enzyme related to lactoylglutathione lyase
MNLNLLVIRSVIPQQLAEFYEQLGMAFEYHQHGNGPFHYSAQLGSAVFEIYPLAKGQEQADKHLRLGFEIDLFDTRIYKLQEQGIKFHQLPMPTEWGVLAVIEDPEGRKLELYNKT